LVSVFLAAGTFALGPREDHVFSDSKPSMFTLFNISGQACPRRRQDIKQCPGFWPIILGTIHGTTEDLHNDESYSV
jgi:hypothetical protein